MTPQRSWIIYGTGVAVGLVLGFFAAPTPEQTDSCSVFKVDRKPVTSYVLKPPPAEVVYKACPQTTEKVCVTKIPENDTQPELSNANDTQKTRRHRRHRVRRYWK